MFLVRGALLKLISKGIAMLVLGLKPGDVITIGEGVVLTCVKKSGERLALGIEAPGLGIMRGNVPAFKEAVKRIIARVRRMREQQNDPRPAAPVGVSKSA